jgi:hypothetical protein
MIARTRQQFDSVSRRGGRSAARYPPLQAREAPWRAAASG